MRYYKTIGCILVLSAAFTGNSNAATAQYNSQLDLSNLQYSVTMNGATGNAAAGIVRFDLGTGWNGAMEILLTTSSYGQLTTSLGIALTTDPNDALYSDPSPFLQLADPANVTGFFNDNVIGWEFYSWGTNIVAGGTTNVTDGFNPALQFDPNEHYYAFVAGGSVISTSVDVSLAVSAVPLPAAVWLFGSGIVGLIGIAKRKTA